MKKLLIECTDKSPTHCDERYTVDGVFLLAEVRDLAPARSNDAHQLSIYLAHRITRNPLDLRAHTQRVYLYLTNRDAGGAYAALLDLFISLGGKGYSLRRHLLQLCSGILDAAQQKSFRSHLKTGLLSTTPLTMTGSSLLHKGVESSLPLISKEEIHSAKATTDPLSEAREYLEYGQLEPAMSTLETAIIADPSQADIMNELLELYKQAGFLERYHAQSQAMIEAGHILPKRWLSAHQQIH
jgi:hypothetical protein